VRLAAYRKPFAGIEKNRHPSADSGQAPAGAAEKNAGSEVAAFDLEILDVLREAFKDLYLP
jgi:hypothetical protein